MHDRLDLTTDRAARAHRPRGCAPCVSAGLALLLTGVAFSFGSPAEAAPKGCLLDSSYCDDFAAPNSELLKLMRKKPSQYIGMDQTSVSIVYATLEDGRKKAEKTCRKNDRVSLEGYRALFVVGSGKSKRALMLKDKNTCSWLRVK